MNRIVCIAVVVISLFNLACGDRDTRTSAEKWDDIMKSDHVEFTEKQQDSIYTAYLATPQGDSAFKWFELLEEACYESYKWKKIKDFSDFPGLCFFGNDSTKANAVIYTYFMSSSKGVMYQFYCNEGNEVSFHKYDLKDHEIRRYMDRGNNLLPTEEDWEEQKRNMLKYSRTPYVVSFELRNLKEGMAYSDDKFYPSTITADIEVYSLKDTTRLMVSSFEITNSDMLEVTETNGRDNAFEMQFKDLVKNINSKVYQVLNDKIKVIGKVPAVRYRKSTTY